MKLLDKNVNTKNINNINTCNLKCIVYMISLQIVVHSQCTSNKTIFVLYMDSPNRVQQNTTFCMRHNF